MNGRPGPVVLNHIDELVGFVQDGDTLVVPADYGGSPAEAARALVRKRVRNLRLIGARPAVTSRTC